MSGSSYVSLFHRPRGSNLILAGLSVSTCYTGAAMFAITLSGIPDLRHLITSPYLLAVTAFHLWMLIDAVRKRDWMWVVFLILFPGFADFWYFFYVYRASPSATRGFELPGAHDRRRIRELQAQIHHLDKPHHYFQLGDIYFQQGKLDKAEACYRSALERDPQDIDTRAHLGQCLLRQKRPAEARPLLEAVCAESPKHDYGYSLMALAETLAALGEIDSAIAVWQRVTENHSYPRARVQLAELYLQKDQRDLASAEVQEVLADAPHAPAFQRKRERVWVRRAKKLARRL
jgi:tetratricopeptide (TPR) repeat protein